MGTVRHIVEYLASSTPVSNSHATPYESLLLVKLSKATNYEELLTVLHSRLTPYENFPPSRKLKTPYEVLQYIASTATIHNEAENLVGIAHRVGVPYEALLEVLKSRLVEHEARGYLTKQSLLPHEARKKFSVNRLIEYEETGQGPMVDPPFLTDCLLYPGALRNGLVHIVSRREHSSVMNAAGGMRKTRLWFSQQALVSVDYAVVDLQFLNELRFFYDCVGGDLTPFYFQDWTNPSPIDEFCGKGDGIRTKFKIRGDVMAGITVYTAAPPSFQKVHVIPASIDFTTGTFVLSSPPAKDVHVIADVVGEWFKCFFQGYSVKHVSSAGGNVPLQVKHAGGLAFRVNVSLIQQKVPF